jgi:S1-C subfamily serine protease
MRFFNFYAFLIGGALLLSCNGKKEYKLEEVLSVEQQQDLRWIKADSCKCFVLNSFAENPLDSVYVSWSGRDSNGLANGFGRLLIEDKDGARLKYEGTVESGFIKGSGVLTKPDKSVYNGGVYFVEYGKGDRVLENGDQETGIFQDGNLYTGKINKVDTTIHRWRSLEITKTEYNRRQKQVNKYFTKPIIRQTTRYYFDSLWIPCKKEDAAYYRLVNMSDVNHPKDGVVTDFYINGNKQNEYEVLHTDLKNHIHIPGVYSKFYLESGELVQVSNNFNWNLNRSKWYNNENKISQEYILQQDYSHLYNLYDENGVITGTHVYDRERKHRYAKLSNGDTTYTVYDSLGYDEVYYAERTSEHFIRKGWYRLFHNDDYSYPISPINYYSKTGKLFETENWINLSDSSKMYGFLGVNGQASYLGDDIVEMNNTSTNAVRHLIDFDFPTDLDWNVKINFKMGSRNDGLVLVYNWEDWDNNDAIGVFNERGGYVNKRQYYEGDSYDYKNYSYRSSTDWKNIDFTKKDNDIILTGLTRNAIPIDEDNLESVGFIFFPETKYNLGHIVQTIFYDTTTINDDPSGLAPNGSTPVKVRPWQSYGSGVALTEDGYVVTNHHVIEDASDVEIGLVENNKIRYYSGEIISKDINNDLALVRISDNSFKGFDRIPYNVELDQASVGKEVFALGYPLKALLGDELKFTNGRISARSGAKGDISKYQMTVPLQPGNSGGPVFDFDGNLIGIAQGGIKYDVAENVAYCVKTTYVQSLVESLPEKFGLPDDRRNRGEDVEDIINEVAPYVTLIRVR